MRVKVERYEDEAEDRIMVYGTDEDGQDVCLRVVGESVPQMRAAIDAEDSDVELELPRSRGH